MYVLLPTDWLCTHIQRAGQTMDLYLQANISHVAQADSGYGNTRARTASLTWSPRQLMISSQTGDLKQEGQDIHYKIIHFYVHCRITSTGNMCSTEQNVVHTTEYDVYSNLLYLWLFCPTDFSKQVCCHRHYLYGATNMQQIPSILSSPQIESFNFNM